MARKQQLPTLADPAEVANRKVLALREERMNERQRTAAAKDVDLGLEIEPTAETAADLLRDEWDKKVFGDTLKTTTRIFYGPDPLLTASPALLAMIEKHGLEDYANATAEAIVRFGANAVPDPVMQKGLRKALARFGPEAVAAAFRERILKIPQKVVDVELDMPFDPTLADPLRDAVEKYGTPGFRPKFLSERCMAVLGDRGYRIVKNEKGDPVKVGTLVMGEIPVHIAEARQRHYAEESEQAVREQEERYTDAQERMLHQAGKVGAGSRPLRADEIMTANATEENASLLGQSRPGGFQLERETGR